MTNATNNVVYVYIYILLITAIVRLSWSIVYICIHTCVYIYMYTYIVSVYRQICMRCTQMRFSPTTQATRFNNQGETGVFGLYRRETVSMSKMWTAAHASIVEYWMNTRQINTCYVILPRLVMVSDYQCILFMIVSYFQGPLIIYILSRYFSSDLRESRYWCPWWFSLKSQHI